MDLIGTTTTADVMALIQAWVVGLGGTLVLLIALGKKGGLGIFRALMGFFGSSR